MLCLVLLFLLHFRDHVHSLVARTVFASNLPLSWVESQACHELVKGLAPGATVPCRRTLSTALLEKEYELCRAGLKQILHKTGAPSNGHLSCCENLSDASCIFTSFLLYIVPAEQNYQPGGVRMLFWLKLRLFPFCLVWSCAVQTYIMGSLTFPNRLRVFFLPCFQTDSEIQAPMWGNFPNRITQGFTSAAPLVGNLAARSGSDSKSSGPRRGG